MRMQFLIGIFMAVACLLSLVACDDDSSVGEVILHARSGTLEGQMKVSAVRKIGPYCWVAWFDRIEKLELRKDGTAAGGPLKYTWELNTPGPSDFAADQKWFDANCSEVRR